MLRTQLCHVFRPRRRRSCVPIFDWSAKGAALSTVRHPLMVAFDVAAEPSFGLRPAQGACREAAHTSEIIAFHGSPEDFDRFDITQIDYSDGCKTYGYGLYF